MTVYGNQKTVQVIHNDICDAQHPYCVINIEAKRAAFKNLNDGAKILWDYFASNQNNYTFALSSAAVEEAYGMKRQQYNNAIKELIEKGYLVQQEGLQYIFYVRPPDKNNNLYAENTSMEASKQENLYVEKISQKSSENTSTCIPTKQAEYSKNTRNNTNITDNTSNNSSASAPVLCLTAEEAVAQFGNEVMQWRQTKETNIYIYNDKIIKIIG